MIRKRLIDPRRRRKIPRQFNWVDHRLVRGGYLKRCSHPALALYLFLTVTVGREVPATFVRHAMTQLRSGDLRGAYQMCEDRDELVAKVLRAGLKVAAHDRFVIQEAMESEGERGAENMKEL